jgi:hypothetical protein
MSTDPSAGPATTTPPGLHPDRLLLADVDTSRAPRFSIGELANCVFGMSTHWVRWREGHGLFDYHEPLPDGGTRRVTPGGRTAANARYYTLSDAERMVVALAANGRIPGEAAAARLQVVYSMARVWRYLPTEDGSDTSIPDEGPPPEAADAEDAG